MRSPNLTRIVMEVAEKLNHALKRRIKLIFHCIEDIQKLQFKLKYIIFWKDQRVGNALYIISQCKYCFFFTSPKCVTVTYDIHVTFDLCTYCVC